MAAIMNKSYQYYQSRYRNLIRYLPEQPREELFFRVNHYVKRAVEIFNLRKYRSITLMGFKRDVAIVEKAFKEAGGGVPTETIIVHKKDYITTTSTDFAGEQFVVELATKDIDCLLICSEICRFLIRMTLITHDAPYDVIDLYESYEYIMGARIKFSVGDRRRWIWQQRRNWLIGDIANFIDRSNKLKHLHYARACYNYDAMFCHLNGLRKAHNSDEKAFYHRKIIEDLYMIKDIKNTCLYVKTYLEEEVAFAEKYKIFLDKLNKLVGEMERAIKDKHGIVVFWVDAVSQKRADECHFLENLKEEALEFRNCYTHIPYTDGTIHSFVTGVPYMEDRVDYHDGRFYSGSFAKKEAKLVNLLEQNNYRILEVGQRYIDMFDPELNSFVLPSTTVAYKYRPSTINFWDALCALACSVKSTFTIIHADCESHHPYWTFDLEKMGIGKTHDVWNEDDKLMNKQRAAALQYIGEQIEWYQKFLPNTSFQKIILSDHGTVAPAYREQRLRPFLFLLGRGVKPGKESRLFSYLDWWKLIQYLITGREEHYSQIFSEYVLVENENPYSSHFIAVAEKNLDDPEFFEKGYDAWCGFRGIIGESIKVIKLHNGDIKVFALPSDVEETVDTDEIAKKYDSLIGDQFEDFSLIKYKESAQFLEKCRARGYRI